MAYISPASLQKIKVCGCFCLIKGIRYTHLASYKSSIYSHLLDWSLRCYCFIQLCAAVCIHYEDYRQVNVHQKQCMQSSKYPGQGIDLLKKYPSITISMCDTLSLKEWRETRMKYQAVDLFGIHLTYFGGSCWTS